MMTAEVVARYCSIKGRLCSQANDFGNCMLSACCCSQDEFTLVIEESEKSDDDEARDNL